MKYILQLTFVLFAFIQLNAQQKELKTTKKFSEDSEITIFHNKDSKKVHANKKPAALFVNGVFIGGGMESSTINIEKIESVNIEKINFENNGNEYYGRILILMKKEYEPNFITLKELVVKYLKVDRKPILFQMDNTIIKQDYNDYLIDENFVLKIIISEAKTSLKDVQFNLVNIITKTKENIDEANAIIIR